MNNALRGLRGLAASLSLAAALTGAGVVLAPLATAEFGTVRAITAVNIRSAPNATSQIVGVLYQGSSAKQTGPTQNGFAPITVNGINGWVSSNYVSGARAHADAPASSSGSTGSSYTIAALNVRTGPSTGSTSLTVLAKGTKVTLTGLVSQGWAQIIWNDQRAWVSTAWISTSPASSSTPSTSTQAKLTSARATADLMIRTSPGAGFTSLGDIPRGTILNLTGRTEPGVAQVLWRGEYRWVNASYLAAVSQQTTTMVPTIPTSIGSQYATTALNIRTTSGSDSKTIAEVPRGTALQVTGKVENGRAQIVWNGAIRWVTAQYLSATKVPLSTGNTSGTSTPLPGLTARSQQVVAETRANFGFITTIYGVRPDPIPDHPSGRAVDLMLPNWSSAEGNARGWEVANYMRANAKRLNIQYVIFDQRIWSVQRDSEGWRLMANRGSATANHRDHVHVTVNS